MEFPKEIEIVLLRLEEAGFEGYLVGGCVRDGVRGEIPHDFDITTNAKPQETMALFSDYPVIESGLQHGTVAIVIDHQPIEITTYRIETTYSDHRHPDAVEFAATIQEDLARRDFTINAMAQDRNGDLIDPFGGRGDLQKGIIRCVGDPRERFSEDALRILRALRFAARFGFEIEGRTKAALLEEAPLLEKIAAERILSELKGILAADYAGEILAEYEPVLKGILPTLCADCDCLKKMKNRESSDSLRFAGWLWKMGKEQADQLLKSLKASTQLRREVGILIEGQQIYYPQFPPSTLLRKGLSMMKKDLFFDHLFLQWVTGLIATETYMDNNHRAVRMVRDGICLSPAELAVSGRDLMELGFLGAEIGRMQKRLFEEVMEERLPNERESLLTFAKNNEK